MTNKPFRRIVLTGAAGKLGAVLRAALRPLADILVLSDVQALREDCIGNEIFRACELSDHGALGELLAEADAVVHFGGVSLERHFERILPANIVGTFNLYDNALNLGVRRVVLASSNHVTGYYPVSEAVTPDMPLRPDSLYAVSKGYGELLARYYHDRHNLDSICLRIGNCNARPRTLRSLDCWLSHQDLCSLVTRALLASDIGFAVVYGVSANPNVWWKSADADRIGYVPQDSSEVYRAELEARLTPNAAPSPLQGGLAGMRDYRFPESLDP